MNKLRDIALQEYQFEDAVEDLQMQFETAMHDCAADMGEDAAEGGWSDIAMSVASFTDYDDVREEFLRRLGVER